MMHLEKIYSEPKNLFEEVEFKPGINVIYGKQVEEGNKKTSLNSIGKSTLIDLINFCLLSDFSKKSKLYKGKDFLDKYCIVLEINIEDKIYKIKRSTNNPKKVFIGQEGESGQEETLDNAKRILYNKMFKNSNYSGISDSSWFRQVINFFIRDEKTGFESPIIYYKNGKEEILNSYHLMLMDIDNTLSLKNKEVREELGKTKLELEGTEKIIEREYGNLDSINSKIDTLSKEIKTLENSKEKFKLNESYKEQEEVVNRMTQEIKKIILENNTLKNNLENYKQSYKLKVDIDTRKISSIYTELNEELGITLKKTLDQAIDFKNNLISSRKDFIGKKVIDIKNKIEINLEKIKELDLKRSEIFRFLENKKAIEDLTELFNVLALKKQSYEDLKSKINLIESLNKNYLENKTKYSKLMEKINLFLTSNKEEISSLRELYNEIYQNLYSIKEGDGFFDIRFNSKKDSKIAIVASSRDGDGFGKNKGCIIAYDLMVLFNIINKRLSYPYFLVHDGAFTGVYKSQFISTMNLLNNKSSNVNFQYIIPLNEDDESLTDEKFGKLDFDIKEHIIATYTNKTKDKIFGREY